VATGKGLVGDKKKLRYADGWVEPGVPLARVLHFSRSFQRDLPDQSQTICQMGFMSGRSSKKSEARTKMRGGLSIAEVPRANVNESEVFPVVGIGASAGGLEAFTELLHDLPEKTGMAFVLVTHLDPKHHSDLEGILSRTTNIPVEEALDGAVVRPDHIYVLPPNTSMVMRSGTLRLAGRVLTRGQHLPIDHFLRSLAEDRGSNAISVILSGMASDGTEGARAIRAAGGINFAQDEKSAKYPGMPHSAIASGCVHFVLAPAEIGRELIRVAKHPQLPLVAVPDMPPEVATGEQIGELLALLRTNTGVDFTHYKQSTLRRRITRRMVLHKLENLRDYVRLVHNTTGEVDELYQDILIHVTGFFRDPDVFVALRQHVFPKLFRDDKKGTIRVWVPVVPAVKRCTRWPWPCWSTSG